MAVEVAGILVVKVVNGDRKILYMKRSSTDDKYPGMWSIVAETREEKDKSIDETAIRGLEEETGLKRKKEELIKIAEFGDEIIVKGKSIAIKVTLYATRMREGEEIRLSEEADAYRFYNKKELQAIPNARDGNFTPTDKKIINEYLQRALDALEQKVKV